MDWFPVWLVIAVMPNGTAVPLPPVKDPPLPTEQACLAYLEKYNDRAPDWFRGRLDLPFDFPIRVKGGCKQDGQEI